MPQSESTKYTAIRAAWAYRPCVQSSQAQAQAYVRAAQKNRANFEAQRSDYQTNLVNNLEVMQALTQWGEVLFIVHTPDIVLECAGKVPPGSFARGYYNLHGDSPIGGHLKAENCTHIAFISRPFMGRPSRSLQFFNGAGEAMFKVFVRRDAERNLLADQVQRFDELRGRLDAEG